MKITAIKSPTHYAFASWPEEWFIKNSYWDGEEYLANNGFGTVNWKYNPKSSYRAEGFGFILSNRDFLNTVAHLKTAIVIRRG